MKIVFDFDLIVVLIFIILTAYFILNNKLRYIVFLIPFAITLFFFVEVGTRWTLWKIFAVTYLVFLLVRRVFYGKFIAPNFLPREFIWLSAYIIISFILQYLRILIVPPPYSYAGYSFQSTQLRPIVQFIGYLLYLFYFLMPLTLVYTRKLNPKYFIHSYLFATTVLCIYGVYQLVAYQFQLPFRTIKYTAESFSIGKFLVGGQSIFRVNSLAGEPKTFALSLLPSIAVLLFIISCYKYFKKHQWEKSWNLILHLVMCILAFSTAGLVGLAVLFFVYILYFIIIFKKRRVFTFIALIIATIFAFLFITYYLGGTEFVLDALRIKIFSNPSPLSVRMEGLTLRLLLQFPWAIFFGFGPGIYNYYVPYSVGDWGVNPIVSSFITMLLDHGIIGIFLFIIFFLKVLRTEFALIKSKITTKTELIWKHCFIVATMGALCGFIVLGGFVLMFYFLGIVWADVYLSKVSFNNNQVIMRKTS